MDKIDDISGGSGASSQIKHQIKEQSKYFGTGQYEQSIGGLSPQQIQTQTLQQQLKLAPAPTQIKAFDIRSLENLVKIKHLDALVGLKVGTLTALKTSTMLKTKTHLKQNLLLKQNVQVLLKRECVDQDTNNPHVENNYFIKNST